MPAASPARVEASRANSLPSGGRQADPEGARSRGPVTPEGKARSARNGTRRGVCAGPFRLLPGEDGADLAALRDDLLAHHSPPAPPSGAGRRGRTAGVSCPRWPRSSATSPGSSATGAPPWPSRSACARPGPGLRRRGGARRGRPRRPPR